MTEHLNAHHVAVLTALRDATALRREPKTLTPDGHERWFSLRQLQNEDRLIGALAMFDPPARTLYKRNLAARRTIQGTVLYALTEQGAALLAGLEERAGITALVAADLETAQARTDIRLAKRREAAALAKAGEIVRSGVRRPTAAELAGLSEGAYR